MSHGRDCREEREGREGGEGRGGEGRGGEGRGGGRREGGRREEEGEVKATSISMKSGTTQAHMYIEGHLG